MKNVIIIPTYNEKDNISTLIPIIFDTIPEIFVVVADDNSPDGTASAVKDLSLRYPHLSLISRQNKDGLGGAYVNAFSKVLEDSEVKNVVMMDADLSHDPKSLVEMLKKSESFSVVIGSRYVLGGNTVGWEFWRKALSFWGNLYCRLITRMPIHDCTGGFNVIRAELLRKINLKKLDMSGYAFIMQLKYSLYKAGATFFEFPITFTNRTGGESKISSHIISEGVLAPWKMIMREYNNL